MAEGKVPNILFSTTRGWNCGDDFILYGVRHLLGKLAGPFNPVIYNRHPDLHFARVRLRQDRPAPGNAPVDLQQAIASLTCNFDNSWRPPQALDAVDHCVFAGTPEWGGKMVEPLVDALVETDIPITYLGVGIFERITGLEFSKLPANEVALLRRAGLITVRDQGCAELLAPVNPVQLPCPALFSAGDTHRPRTRGDRPRIALSTQGTSNRNGQRIDGTVNEFTIHLFRKLAGRYDCSLVCHYADELWELEPLLGDSMPIRYSYDPLDYRQIYDGFDLTVTTRIHGAGLCASLGIPGIVISHSARSNTASGFLSEFVNPDKVTMKEVEGLIENIDIGEVSSRIIAHKAATEAEYLRLLRPLFAGDLQ